MSQVSKELVSSRSGLMVSDSLGTEVQSGCRRSQADPGESGDQGEPHSCLGVGRVATLGMDRTWSDVEVVWKKAFELLME